jgi:hypothetical protein
LLPLKYLGLPLGDSYKPKSLFETVIEKIERRLASWKMMYLFKGGREALSRFLIWFARRKVQISPDKLMQDLFSDL